MEPIRIKYKNDAEGVGFKVKDDQWVAHGEEFSAVLGQLNGVQESDDSDMIGFKQEQETTTISINSLEKRSKSSKARVHYHKFTRGKDLTRYSATDMASILGKRPSFAEKAIEVKEEVVEEISQTEDHSHGVTTIPKGNLNDYFASKMAALREKQNRQQQEPVTEGETTEQRRVRFDESLNEVKEFCSKDKIVTNDVKDPVVTDGASAPKKSKKDKSKKKNRLEQCLADEAGEAVLLEVEPEPLPKKQKKKKAKAMQEEEEEAMVVTTENTVDSSNVTKKKKKKKKNKMNDESNEEELVYTPAAEVVEQPEDVTEWIEVQKKKKKNKKKDVATQQVEEAPTESPHQPEEMKTSKRKKSGEDDQESAEIPQKKKKKKNRQEGCNVLVAETSEPTAEVEEATAEIKTEKRKKKKKIKEEEPIESIEEPETEPPSKKKKKSKKGAAGESDAQVQVKTENVDKDQQAANIEMGMQQYWLGKDVEEKAARVKETKDRIKETRKNIDRAYAITDCRAPSLLVSKKCSNSEQFAHLNTDFFVGKRLKDVMNQFEEVDFSKFNGANLHLIPGYGTMLS